MATRTVLSCQTLPALSVLLAVLVTGALGAGESCEMSAIQTATGLRRCLTEVQTAAKTDINSNVIPETVNLKVYIDAVFRSPETETYDFCCDSMDVGRGVYRLNPLDQTQPENYLLRRAPYLTFYPEANSGVAYGDNKYYMVACFDVRDPDRPWVHWLSGNIRGLDMATVTTWYGWMNLAMGDNHVIVLYQQAGYHNGDMKAFGTPNIGPTCIDNRCDFGVDLAMASAGLTVLGLTWVKPKLTRYEYNHRATRLQLADACTGYPDTPMIPNSVTCPRDICNPDNVLYNINQCLIHVRTGGRLLAPSVIASNLDLKVYIEASFTVPDFMLEVCCHTEEYMGGTYTLKTLDKPRPMDWQVINKPALSFVNKAGVTFGQSSDAGWYTLALYDVASFEGETGKSDPTNAKFYINWLTINFQRLQVQDGTEMLPYQGPAGKQRRMLLVLYRHNTRANINNVAGYVASSGCFPGTTNRCMFDATRFAQDRGMTVVGISWFYPQHTAYSVFNAYTVLGLPKTLQCRGSDPSIGESGGNIVCPKSKCTREARDNNMASCLTSTASGGDLIIPEVLPSGSNLRLNLELTFTTDNRRLLSCCLDKTIPGRIHDQQPLDPTMYSVFNYKTKPAVEILAKDAANTANMRRSQYLLIVLDLDDGTSTMTYSYRRFTVHWAVANIKDLDVSKGNELYTYYAPATGNALAVLLFQQVSTVGSLANFIQTSQTCTIPNRCGFHLIKMIKDLRLVLFGASWIIPRQTPLTDMVNRMENRNRPATEVCPSLFREIKVQNSALLCPARTCTTAIVQNPNLVKGCLDTMLTTAKTKLGPWADDMNELLVYIKTTHSTGSFKYKVCCKEYSVGSGSVTVNPIEWKWPQGSQLRLKPTVEFIVRADRSTNALVSRANNQFYFLFLGDVSGGPFTEGRWSPEKPLLHWAVANMRSMSVNEGTELVTYLPPTAHRTYMYMLFKQTLGSQTFDVSQYVTTAGCFPQAPDRCNFDLYRFIKDYKLTPIGVSWVTPADSPYAGYSAVVHLGLDYKLEACRRYEPEIQIISGQAWCDGTKPTDPPSSAGIHLSPEGVTGISLALGILVLLLAV